MSIFVARLRSVKPTRVAPKAAASFGEGLIVADKPGRHTPIDQRTLPAIDGAGLTTEEWFVVNGRSNQVKAEYARSMPAATHAELHAVGQRAATDALRQVLKARPAAPELVVKAEPVKADRWIEVEMVPLTRTPARKSARFEPSTEDRLWWAQYTELAANSLAPISGGSPEFEPAPECGISGLWSMPGEDLTSDMDRWLEDACPDEAPETGHDDDANGQFGCVRDEA